MKLPVAGWLPLRLALAAVFLATAAVLAWDYPLGRWQAVAALVAWVAVLWRRPVLWFMLLPAITPSLDLGPWTGWIAISEADIAVLATVACCCCARRRPARTSGPMNACACSPASSWRWRPSPG
jgi:hypothetical protein